MLYQGRDAAVNLYAIRSLNDLSIENRHQAQDNARIHLALDERLFCDALLVLEYDDVGLCT